MGVAVKDIRDVVAKMNFRKCGTITCIYNVDGKCSQKNVNYTKEDYDKKKTKTDGMKMRKLNIKS